MDKALEKALEVAGGVTALAEKLTGNGTPITKSAVSQWDRCPIERALAVEAATGVSRYELRPDIYGTAPTEAAA